jgi:hypothetical protein
MQARLFEWEHEPIAGCRTVDHYSPRVFLLQADALKYFLLPQFFTYKWMHTHDCFFSAPTLCPASPRSTASHIGRNTNDLFGFPFLVHPNSCKYISRIDVANPISEVTHC